MQILTPPPRTGGDTGGVPERQLEAAALGRITRITAELRARNGGTPDEIDALAARLLLSEYTSVVAGMRSIVRQAGQRIDGAAEAVREARRFLWRDEKFRTEALQTLEADVEAGSAPLDS